MDFATIIILVSVSIGVMLLASMAYFTQHSDDMAKGVLWGLSMGVCLGVIIGAGMFTNYWEKKLIREGIGEYEFKSPESRESNFKLVKPLPIVTKEIITEKDAGETCNCPNCNWQFLSPKAARALYNKDRMAYDKYMENQKNACEKPVKREESEQLCWQEEMQKKVVLKLQWELAVERLEMEKIKVKGMKRKAELEAEIELRKIRGDK